MGMKQESKCQFQISFVEVYKVNLIASIKN